MCLVDLEKAFDRNPQVCVYEYKVLGPRIRAIHSLYDQSQSLFHITGSKLDSFLVSIGLCQGCPLSPILFITFIKFYKISWRSHGVEGVRFDDLRILCSLMMWLNRPVTSSSCWIGS